MFVGHSRLSWLLPSASASWTLGLSRTRRLLVAFLLERRV